MSIKPLLRAILPICLIAMLAGCGRQYSYRPLIAKPNTSAKQALSICRARARIWAQEESSGAKAGTSPSGTNTYACTTQEFNSISGATCNSSTSGVGTASTNKGNTPAERKSARETREAMLQGCMAEYGWDIVQL